MYSKDKTKVKYINGDAADYDDSDRWDKHKNIRKKWRRREKDRKCKCKHTINCWHKTHKFKRKLNYVTQYFLFNVFQMSSICTCKKRLSRMLKGFSVNFPLVSSSHISTDDDDEVCVKSLPRNSLSNELKMMELLINVVRFSFLTC